ncbi:MAG: VOC family protein [Acidimicrobiales bacterium]
MDELGSFSVSLNVADLGASMAFYQTLGFRQIAGEVEQNWAILASGSTIIGLFQGMFPTNILTFNPGGAPDETDPDFTDIRDIQKRLVEAGIELSTTVEGDRGPGHFMLSDPDGNQILFDQHR